MSLHQARGFWSIPASILCCIVLCVLISGTIFLQKFDLVNVPKQLVNGVFWITTILLTTSNLILIYVYLYTVSKKIDPCKKHSIQKINDKKETIELVLVNPEGAESSVTVLPASNAEFICRRRSFSGFESNKTTSTETAALDATKLAVLATTIEEKVVRAASIIDLVVDSIIPRMRDYEDAYTKFCVCVLGTGSLLYCGILANDTLNSLKCKNQLLTASLILSMFFIIVQAMLFIDPFKRINSILVRIQERSDWPFVVAVRYSFMICFAGNFSLWLYAVITEAHEDYCRREMKKVEYTNNGSNETVWPMCQSATRYCYKDTLGEAAGIYLVPLMAEFGLFMGQALIAWFHYTASHTNCLCEPQPENLSVIRQGKWGIFVGAIALILQFASLIKYQQSRGEQRSMSIKHAELIDAFLCFSGICASIALLVRINQLKLKSRRDQLHFEETVHLFFIFMTYASMIIYFGIHLFAALTTDEDSRNVNLIAFLDGIAPIDGSLQVLVLWLVSYKEGRDVKMHNSLISLMIFLFCENLAIWAAASYRYAHADRLPSSELTRPIWTLVTHLTVPMIIYFRFQLAESWNHFYT